MSKIKITFVGSGDYCNHGGRAQQAILFERDGQGLMVDFGANTCAALKKLAIPYSRFQTVLLTHYHGDHFGGLPYMIAELGNSTDAPKMTIIGPGETAARVGALTAAMGYSEPNPAIFTMTDFYDGLQTPLCRISALPMAHRPESLGYRLDFGDTLIAVTGDTSWCDNVPRLAVGSQLLITDCNQEKGFGVHISLEVLLEHRAELKTANILPVHIDDLGPNSPLPPVYDGAVYFLDGDKLVSGGVL